MPPGFFRKGVCHLLWAVRLASVPRGRGPGLRERVLSVGSWCWGAGIDSLATVEGTSCLSVDASGQLCRSLCVTRMRVRKAVCPLSVIIH